MNMNDDEQEPSPDSVSDGEGGNSFYRTIKTYVMRAGRMTAAQEKAYNELSHKYCVPYEEKPLNFVEIFGNTNPIVVEIGFRPADSSLYRFIIMVVREVTTRQQNSRAKKKKHFHTIK